MFEIEVKQNIIKTNLLELKQFYIPEIQFFHNESFQVISEDNEIFQINLPDHIRWSKEKLMNYLHREFRNITQDKYIFEYDPNVDCISFLEQISISNSIEIVSNRNTFYDPTRLRINCFRHRLQEQDTILIVHSLSFQNIPDHVLNSTHQVDKIVDEHVFEIVLPTYNEIEFTEDNGNGGGKEVCFFKDKKFKFLSTNFSQNILRVDDSKFLNKFDVDLDLCSNIRYFHINIEFNHDNLLVPYNKYNLKHSLYTIYTNYEHPYQDYMNDEVNENNTFLFSEHIFIQSIKFMLVDNHGNFVKLRNNQDYQLLLSMR